MIILVAKYILLLFGLCLIAAGCFMLLNPEKARALVQKAGSTVRINYAELLLRMIPAAAFIIYASFSAYPAIFTAVGWFMVATSVVLLLIPREKHHQLACYFARHLQPWYFRVLAPFSAGLGLLVISSAW